jgi:putative PIN family toxin of toxin-antitoxin system
VRVVLDTNTVVSGLLWEGASSALLRAARERRIELFTSAALLAELTDVLPRTHFTRKLAAAGLSVAQLVSRYALLAKHIIPADIYAHIKDDPDDDAVLACALAATADLIVSGDAHLRNLKHYQRIQMSLTNFFDGQSAFCDQVR